MRRFVLPWVLVACGGALVSEASENRDDAAPGGTHVPGAATTPGAQPAPVVEGGRLYAGYLAGHTIVGHPVAARDGEAPVITQLDGDNVPGGIAIDSARDILFATASFNTTELIIVRNASTPDASAPEHIVTGLTSQQGVAVDSDGDRLFVAGFLEPRIAIFDGASTLHGTVSPSRQITDFSPEDYPRGLAYDAAHDRLFVACGRWRIDIFDHASSANGARGTLVSRTVNGGPGGPTRVEHPLELAYDPVRDELYVANGMQPTTNSILVFANASTMNGRPEPARVIGLPGVSYSGQPQTADGIALDLARDVLYVASEDRPEVIVIQSAHTANGVLAEGDMTKFGFPNLPLRLAFDPAHR